MLTGGDSLLTARDTVDAGHGFGSPYGVPEPLVGVTGVRAMLAAFARLGLDVGRIQAESGLSEDELADPDRFLRASRLYRLWSVADALWSRPALGLETGARVPFGAYEVLDYLIASGPTLGDGIRDFAAFFSLATRTARYDVDETGRLVRCEMVWRIPPRGVMFQLRDYSLSAVARRVKEAGGGAPARVEIEGPPLTTEGHYARVFGARIVLHAPANALLFTRERWTAPMPRADATLGRTLRRHAELLLERSAGTSGESLSQRVRSELLQRVRVGLPTIGEVGRTLGVGPRTLQRQLRREGTSYVSIADEIRASLAAEYLRDPALSVGEVAYLLGFSAPSAFTRAFRRWAGQSPEEFRRAHVVRS